MTPNGIHWVDMKNTAVVPSYGFGCDNPSVDTLALPLRGWGFFLFSNSACYVRQVSSCYEERTFMHLPTIWVDKRSVYHKKNEQLYSHA